MSTRILLADDHGVVRKGLRFVLERQAGMEVVGEAADGRDAVRLAETTNPDIVIMDVGMPLLNGIEATAQMVKRNPAIGVIILSMHSDEHYILSALNAGAKGYLLKGSAEEDLVRAIHAVSRGTPFFSPEITKTMLEDYMRFLQQRNLQDSYDLLDGKGEGSAAIAGGGQIEQRSRHDSGHQRVHGRYPPDAPDAEAESPQHRRDRPLRGSQKGDSLASCRLFSAWEPVRSDGAQNHLFAQRRASCSQPLRVADDFEVVSMGAAWGSFVRAQHAGHCAAETAASPYQLQFLTAPEHALLQDLMDIILQRLAESAFCHSVTPNEA